jgi:hypothetical protein
MTFKRLKTKILSKFRQTSCHADIAWCLCGNHDGAIDRIAPAFNALRRSLETTIWPWAEDTYNIVLNTSLFNDPPTAQDLYIKQLSG